MLLIKNRPDLLSIFDADKLIINGTEYNNFKPLWLDIVNKFIEEHLLNYDNSMIHGDLCFSNILYSPKSNIFKFIDPRGSFGDKGIYGDSRYDIAKLYHSANSGYEFIINDKFQLYQDGKEFELTFINDSEKYKALIAFENEFFKDTLPEYKKSIKIIEGCIFIGMVARHFDDKRRQLAMYLLGVKLLNEAMSL